MQRFFPREMNALGQIFEFVEAFLDSGKIDRSNSFAVNLIIEELFTNMVKYSPEGSRDISIQLDRENGELIISLTDFDVDPFDITQAPAVDTTQSLEERRIGGLGLHFVRQVSDGITYKYEDRNSMITVRKRLDHVDV